MNLHTTLEERDIELQSFEDVADQVTGDEYSVQRSARLINPRASRPNAWFPKVVRQFQALERLRAGWDSQDSAPPNRETIRSGARLLHTLAIASADLAQPHIHPTRSGGVQFSWESGRRYFEIELLDPHTARYYFVDSDSHDETEGELRVGDSVAQVLHFVQTVEQSP